MTLVVDFDALASDYQQVLQQAQIQHKIQITPLQALRGGNTGAQLHLVSISQSSSHQVQHAILKLDHVNPKARAGEMELHEQALRLSPPDFARKHIPAYPYQPVKSGETSAIFYAIAGQSLHNYRSLASYTQSVQLETIFSAAFRYLLREWNADAAFEQAAHPQSLFPRWLSYRLNPGGNIERFFVEILRLPADLPGLVIQGRVFPNPFRYARDAQPWGSVRPIDVLTGFQHGDLNTANLLVRFAPGETRLDGFFLIDFALFKAGMPLLYDHTYLILSHLIQELARMPFSRWIELVIALAADDLPDPARAPVEAAGAVSAIRAGRVAFTNWIAERHPSLNDDLWAQYRLAAVAAGLNFCNKTGVSERERLAGLIYAAAHLQPVLNRFGAPLPTEVQVLPLDFNSNAAPPLAYSPTAPAARFDNLPLAPTSFVGREEEVQQLAAMLQRDEVRLVTLTGMGGAGKSRLALQVGARLVDAFEHGVCFIPLADVHDPDLVLSTISQQLGLREGGNQPMLDNVRGYLQPRRMLLLVDNFEQVIDSASLVADLLAVAPGLKALVTSRTPLNLRGEHEFPVPPLRLPASPQSLAPADAHRYEAIHLFIQRAQAVQPSFHLTTENAPAVASLCQQLDGLPLAIELAATRVKMITPQAMLSRLGDRLRLLTGGARDQPTRQQTLRQTIDWSYDLLGDSAKRLFARLATFSGGWDLEAAEAVCNPAGDLDDVLASLEGLVNSSLVHREETPDGRLRFRYLETIRAYALEKLAESGETARMAEAHAFYYHAQADRIGLSIYGADAQRMLAWFAAEHDNMRAALAWFLESGRTINLGVGILSVIIWFWYRRGHLREAREWARRYLERMNRQQPSPELAYVLGFSGTLAMWQGDLEFSIGMNKEAVTVAEVSEDEVAIGFAYMGMGVVQLNRGDAAAARPFLQGCLEIFRGIQFVFGISNSLIHLANASLALGDIPAARAYLEQAMPVAQGIGEPWLIASVLNNRGEVARVEGDYEQAQQYYLQSEQLFGVGGDREDQNRLVHNLGYIALYQGRLAEAAQRFRQSLIVFRELGNQRGIAECLAGFARLAQRRGQPVEAATLLGAASTLIRSAGADWWPSDQVEYRNGLSEIQSSLTAEAFDTAWREGKAMNMEQALAYQANLSADW